MTFTHYQYTLYTLVPLHNVMATYCWLCICLFMKFVYDKYCSALNISSLKSEFVVRGWLQIGRKRLVHEKVSVIPNIFYNPKALYIFSIFFITKSVIQRVYLFENTLLRINLSHLMLTMPNF